MILQRNSTFAVLLIACLTTTPIAAREIAITIDDLPYVMPSRTSPSEGLAQVEAINQALANHGITATGFAVGIQITDESIPALTAFADVGHSCLDVSRFDAALLIAFTATKETDYGTETDGGILG